MNQSRSGFISIVGKPNVGKSTLLNQLVGTKLAGVSKKPQTTRAVIRGILTEPRGQLVFLDTPGYHKPQDALGKFMIREATKTFLDADIFFLMVEPIPVDPTVEMLLDRIKSEMDQSGKKPVFCIINKVDSVAKPNILPVMEAYHKLFTFDELIPISALKGDQLALLLEKAFSHLPAHEPYFPPDVTSDQTERFLVAELIREKIFRFTGEEVPYSTVVEIEEFKEEDKLIRIHAVIFTEKDSQKAIVIGAGGKKMKQMGTAARLDLEKFLGKKVFLKLWAKTLKNWKKDEIALKRLGLS
jgi:GTPase